MPTAVRLGPGPLAAGLVAVILWGLAPVATRAAVAHLAPLPLLVLRLTVASLVMLPWAVPVFRRLRPRSAGRLLAAGILGLVGYNLPVTIGLRWLPASTAGLLLATEPVWVMLLGRVFLGERGGARAWLGSAVALSGVAVLAGPGALAGAGGYRALAGAGLILAGTLAFGGYTIVLRPLSQAYGAVPATAASTVVGTLPYLAFAGTLPGPRWRTWTRPRGASSPSWHSAARRPACCSGTWPSCPAAPPGSACCSTSSRWSPCSERRPSSASA
jgi:drug/metabolite transporter (DMT)-like permease